MKERIKCPECGSERIKVIGDRCHGRTPVLRCMECGTRFPPPGDFSVSCAWKYEGDGNLKAWDDKNYFEGTADADCLFSHAVSLFRELVAAKWHYGDSQRADSDFKAQMNEIERIIQMIKAVRPDYDFTLPKGDIALRKYTALDEKALNDAFAGRYWANR